MNIQKKPTTLPLALYHVIHLEGRLGRSIKSDERTFPLITDGKHGKLYQPPHHRTASPKAKILLSALFIVVTLHRTIVSNV